MATTVFKNPSLRGTSVGKILVLTLMDVSLEGDRIIGRKFQDFILKQVTKDKLSKIRDEGIPSFVLKHDGKLYWTQIPKNTNLVGSTMFGKHQCASTFCTCEKMSAASEEEGGCEKVRKFGKGIEILDFIEQGYETFGTNCDACVVGKCNNYKKERGR